LQFAEKLEGQHPMVWRISDKAGS